MFKKFVYLGIFISLFICSLNAEEQLSFAPIYRLRNGTLNEFVYIPYKYEYLKYSELNWNIVNLSYTGGKIKYSKNCFTYEMTLLYGFKSRSGSMYDSDWYDYNINPDMKTTFSKSENTVSRAMDFAAKVSAEKFFLEWLKAGLFFNLDIDFIDFSARNGYGWYGELKQSKNNNYNPYNSPYANFYEKGQLFGIDYRRMSVFPDFGIFCTFLFSDIIRFSPYFAISPCVFVNSIDHHYGKNNGNFYKDEMKGFLPKLNTGGTLYIKLNNHFCMIITGEYNFLNLINGPTYQKSGIAGSTFFLDKSCIAACSGSWWDFNFSVSYLF